MLLAEFGEGRSTIGPTLTRAPWYLNMIFYVLLYYLPLAVFSLLAIIIYEFIKKKKAEMWLILTFIIHLVLFLILYAQIYLGVQIIKII
jgi:hypothetical protein